MNKAFITGATGEIGSHLIPLLQSTDHPFRILCRRQAQVDQFEAKGIEVVLGNLNDETAKLASLIQGCDVLFLNVGALPDLLKQHKNAINAAIASGTIKWIIKIGAGDARLGTKVPWVTGHYYADEYLREMATTNGIKYTILKASGFMSNFIAQADAIKKGFLPQCCGNGTIGLDDTYDIASVAQKLLHDGPSKYSGQEILLTGPALLTMREVAQAFTRVLGYKVRYFDLPAPVFKRLLRLGVDEWMANGLIAQFNDIIRPNLEDIEVSNAIEDITGRPATSIDQWIEKNKDKFRGWDVVPYLQAGAAISVAVVAVGLLTRLN